MDSIDVVYSDAIDYTKCLEKGNTPTEVQMPCHMDHITFVSLDGEDLIKICKLFDNVLIREGITEELLTLYRIWNYLKKLH
ncbi:hypothetical protein FQA39_LY19013 [Lamprigera yunnana]|nr:hypothetical protein FQA39_LY19013 [Lamprigera yunnana]